MFKKFGKIVPVALIGAMVMSTSVFAADGTVAGGKLNFSNNTTKTSLVEGTDVASAASGIGFGAIGTIKIDDVDGTFTPVTTQDFVRVDDNRGTNEGWNVKVKATDLTTTVADKTSVVEGAKLTVTLPIQEFLQVAGANRTAITGTTTGVETTSQVALNTTGVTVLNALAGNGAGAYTSDLTYTLTMKNYLPTDATISTTDANSKFANVVNKTEIGLFAGQYSTTVTYDISLAP